MAEPIFVKLDKDIMRIMMKDLGDPDQFKKKLSQVHSVEVRVTVRII